jgi:hypothetical protein
VSNRRELTRALRARALVHGRTRPGV